MQNTKGNTQKKTNHWRVRNGNEQPNETRKKRNGSFSLSCEKKWYNKRGIDFSLFFRFLNYFTFILSFAELAVVTNFATFLMLFFDFLVFCRTFAALAGFLLSLLLRLISSWFLMMLFSLCVRYFFGIFFSKKERCILSLGIGTFLF